MSAPVFDSVDAVLAAVGQTLGSSQWLTIAQDRVNLFADATDDHQWIHVDVEKASAGPFGAPIAHGYLSLSLASRFLPEIVDVRMKMGVNYGLDKVRFPSPVKFGSRIRGKGELIAAEKTKDGGDRKSGVEGKRVSVGVDSGGRRTHKKKKT